MLLSFAVSAQKKKIVRPPPRKMSQNAAGTVGPEVNPRPQGADHGIDAARIPRSFRDPGKRPDWYQKFFTPAKGDITSGRHVCKVHFFGNASVLNASGRAN